MFPKKEKPPREEIKNQSKIDEKRRLNKKTKASRIDKYHPKLQLVSNVIPNLFIT